MSVTEMVKVRRRTNIVGRQSRISCRVENFRSQWIIILLAPVPIIDPFLAGKPPILLPKSP